MDYAAARRHMVESQVRTNDVTDLRVQEALLTAPREVFLPAGFREQAYVEREIEYAPGRRLLTARDFGKLLDAAEIDAGDLVLDVGCGAGYSTAVLSGLCEMVVAIESDETLAAQAQENLSALDIGNAAVITGPLEEGGADQGPYDVIFLGAAIAREPQKLLAQLKPGGRLATILRTGGVSRGVVYTRAGDAGAPRMVFNAATTAILPGFELPKTFKF